MNDEEQAIGNVLEAARENGLLRVNHFSCLVRIGPGQAAAIASIHVLWKKANIRPGVGAAILAAWPEIQKSLTKSLWFRCDPLLEETDPFAFYNEILPESIPVSAIDEYIDVIDERVFTWRRPKVNIPAFGKVLLSGNCEGMDPAAYLEALQVLRKVPDYEIVWLGFDDGNRFIQNRHAEDSKSPSLSSASAEEPRGCSLLDSYSTKISINLSLPVREMRRRSLGLKVIPLHARRTRHA